MVTRDNDIIVRDSEILGGIPGGARPPSKNLLDYIEGGHTREVFT